MTTTRQILDFTEALAKAHAVTEGNEVLAFQVGALSQTLAIFWNASPEAQALYKDLMKIEAVRLGVEL